jgi:hypothetical protein
MAKMEGRSTPSAGSCCLLSSDQRWNSLPDYVIMSDHVIMTDHVIMSDPGGTSL